MTEARLARCVPDIGEARAFLARSRGFINDAQARDVSDAGRQLLLYQACVAACDAGLQAAGFKVEGSDGGHVLRFEATVEHLDLPEDLLERLHDAREVRGGSAYQAGVVFDDQVDATAEAAAQLLEAVSAFIDASSGDSHR